MASLKIEILQEPPFSSVEEEAFLNLLRSADHLERVFQQKIRGWGLTATQYNVLRILRGAHPGGLACAALGERMIAAEPDMTRLLGRLKRRKLIRQHRDRRDRRVVLTTIAAAGMELLRAMDPVVRESPREMLGHMRQADLAELIRLLELTRAPSAEPPRRE